MIGGVLIELAIASAKITNSFGSYEAMPLAPLTYNVELSFSLSDPTEEGKLIATVINRRECLPFFN